MPVVKMLEHGQVTIPKQIRDRLGLKKGDLAEATLEGERIIITPKRLVEKEAILELKRVLEGVHVKNSGVSEEEVVQYARQAIAELRTEDDARRD